jgi:hypothetical protein
MPDAGTMDLYKPENLYPAYAKKIEAARRAGIPIHIILNTLKKREDEFRDIGFSEPQVSYIMRRGLSDYPEASAAPTQTSIQGYTQRMGALAQELQQGMTEEQRANLPEDRLGSFASGLKRGVSLGYWGADDLVSNPGWQTAGELAGGLAPGLAAFAATGPVGGAAVFAGRPLAALLAREAITGGILGGAWNAPNLSSRVTHAGMGAVAGPAVGQAGRYAGRGLARLLGRGQRIPTGGTPPPAEPSPATSVLDALPSPVKVPLTEAAEPPITPRPEFSPATTGSVSPSAGVVEPTTAPKQPWQMGLGEFQEWLRAKQGVEHSSEVGMAAHKNVVKSALQRGEKVPAEVLADYPDLAPTAGASEPITRAAMEQAVLPGLKAQGLEPEEALQILRNLKTRDLKSLYDQLTKATGDAPTVLHSLNIHGRRGRPTTRLKAQGFSDEQARVVAAHRLQRELNISPEEALSQIQDMERTSGLLEVRNLASKELADFKTREGLVERTGKPGRPVENRADTLAKGETFEVQTSTGDVERAGYLPEFAAAVVPEGIAQKFAGPLKTKGASHFADPKVTVEPGLSFRDLNQRASSRGYKIRVNGPGDYELLGPNQMKVKTLQEADRFLQGQPEAKIMPVERETGGGMTTLDRVITEQPLTKTDHINISNQRALVQGTQEQLLPDIKVSTPAQSAVTATYDLAGRQMGSVENIRTSDDIMKAVLGVKKSGHKSTLIQTHDGYELVYYRELTPEIKTALNLYEKAINGGSTKLNAQEHAVLGKLFGIPDEDLLKFVSAFTGKIPPSVAGGAGTVPHIRSKFVNPLAQPMLSGSPLIRQAGFEGQRSEAASLFELKGWSQFLQDNIINKVGKDPQLSAKALRVLEGDEVATSGPVAEAVQSYRKMLSDFAKDMGEKYQHTMVYGSIKDALYSKFVDHFARAKNISDLDELVQMKMSAGDLLKVKQWLQKYPTYKSAPLDVRKFFNKLWDFTEIGLTDWDLLPGFIRNELPREIFHHYVVPGPRAPETLVQSFQRIVPTLVHSRHFDPLIRKWGEMVRALPGPDLPFTEKGYLKRYVDSVFLQRPAKTDMAIKMMMDKVNSVLGRELADPDKLALTFQLFRSGFYRGALGPDSAFVNLTQSLNTWAEGGRVLPAVSRTVQQWAKTKEHLRLFGEFTDIMREGYGRVPGSRMIQKIQDVDETLTKFVLSPFSITENVNRGIAFWAGLEDAALRGMSFNQGLASAVQRASQVVPNLELSDAVMQSLFKFVPKTQFGTTQAARSPLFRGSIGRLSSMLVTYPTQQMQFLTGGLMSSGKGVARQISMRGFSDGIAQAIRSGDAGRLARFMAVSGAFALLPTTLAKMGMDIRNQFGMQGVLGNLTFPFYRMIGNAYGAVLGETPGERAQAQKQFGQFIQTVAGGAVGVPVRYAKKMAKVYDTISRGYAVNDRNQLLYYSTPMGEILRLAGINPEQAFQARDVSRELFNIAQRHRLEKREAIEAILDGNPAAMLEYTKAWGRPITPEDIQRVVQQRMMTPAQRQGRGMPKELYQRSMLERGMTP